MSITRVIALGIGWIVMLAGSLACIGAAVLAVSFAAGAAFVSGWSFPLIVAAVGFGLMAAAMPLMFFGCEARADIRANGVVPCPALAGIALRVPVIPDFVPAMPALPALAMAGNARHLSSFAVHTLEHRR